MRAIIHAHARQRMAAMTVSLIQHRCHDSHVADRLRGTTLHILLHDRAEASVCILQVIALLRDREADHLQRRRAENLLHPRKILFAEASGDQGLYDTSDHRFLNCAIRLKRYQNAQILMGTVNLLDNLRITAARSNQPPVHHAAIQQFLYYVCLKRPENITRAEMQPHRLLHCPRGNLFIVKLREKITGLRKALPLLFDSFSCQFHFILHTPYQTRSRSNPKYRTALL